MEDEKENLVKAQQIVNLDDFSTALEFWERNREIDSAIESSNKKKIRDEKIDQILSSKKRDVYEIPEILGHKGIESDQQMYLSVLKFLGNNMSSTILKSIRSTIRDKKIDRILD